MRTCNACGLSLLGRVRGVCKLAHAPAVPPVSQGAPPGCGGALTRARPALARSDLHQSLRMTVAIPLLNGVPPESEFLRCAPAAPRPLPDLSARRATARRGRRAPRTPRARAAAHGPCCARSAIATGGGFVEKVATVWNFY